MKAQLPWNTLACTPFAPPSVSVIAGIVTPSHTTPSSPPLPLSPQPINPKPKLRSKDNPRLNFFMGGV
jgi:hypothetical protein